MTHHNTSEVTADAVTRGTATIQETASEAADWFELDRRDPDDPESAYVRTKDGAPAWIVSMVRNAHDDARILPDDWIYAKVRDALDALSDWDGDGDPEDELLAEFADNATDVYTSDRLTWLGSHLSRAGYVDDATCELGHSDGGIIGDIALGQFAEAASIFGSVLSSLREHTEEGT